VSEIWWSLEPGEIELDDERTISHDPFNGSARSKRGWQVRGTLDTFPGLGNPFCFTVYEWCYYATCNSAITSA